MAVGRQHRPPAAEVPRQRAQRLLHPAAQPAFRQQPLGGGVEGDAAGPRPFVQRPQRGVADAAFRGVNDPLEGEVVRRLRQHAEVGDRVPDFGPLVKAQAADDPVGQAERDHPFLESTGLEAGPHQDRHLGQAVAAAPVGLHPAADQPRLFLGIPQRQHFHVVALGVVAAGPQGLAEPALVMREQPGGGGQDRRGRAVVRFQPDDLGTRKIPLELQDVLDLGTPPGIDALVVVADAADVLFFLRQQAEPVILHQVGVLVLVHQDVAEGAVVVRQHFRVALQKVGGEQQEVAEIGRVQRAQPVLVGAVQSERPAVGEVALLVGRHLAGAEAAVLPFLDLRHQRVRRPALRVHLGGVHDLLEQPHLVVGIEDREIALQAHPLGVAPQHPGRERVEGAEPQPLRWLAQDLRHPLAHLARRLVGEGDGEDLVGKSAARKQDVGEAGGEHPGLAGARPRQHQHRPLGRFHRLALRLVQAIEVAHAAGFTPRMRAIA